MINAKKIAVTFIKQLDLGSAIAVRLTKITGKSKVPLHPKHFLTEKPWFTKYIEKEDIVLDLGCGNGQNSIKVARFAKRVIGVDTDSRSLEIAKETSKNLKIKNIFFQKTNLEEKLQFKNDMFDKILLLDVLEHLYKRDQILAGIHRILKNQGVLLLAVPNTQTSWKKFQRSAGICSFSDPDHKIEFTKRSISNLLSKNHFKIINFGYSRYDIPLRGIVDILGSISLSFYKMVSDWRVRKVKDNPKEASGFEIVVKKL